MATFASADAALTFEPGELVELSSFELMTSSRCIRSNHCIEQT